MTVPRYPQPVRIITRTIAMTIKKIRGTTITKKERKYLRDYF